MVLVFLLNHSTAPVSLGGAERSLFELVERWHQRDSALQSFFITKHPAGQAVAALKARRWQYEAIPFRGWADASPKATASQVGYFATVDYAAVQRCIELMEAKRPDVVITNTLVAPWAAFAAATLGIPHVWFVREYGDLDHGMRFQLSREETYSDIGTLSQLVVANSHALAEHLSEYIPSTKLAVLHPSVDGEGIRKRAELDPALNPFPHPDPGLRIAVTGRLSKSKGQWRVIDAVAALKDRGVSASLCLIGSPASRSYGEWLLDRARQLGVDDRVVFAGELDNPHALVQLADVAVTPSTIEAFGRVTLEYMHLAKPVVAMRSGGSAELVVDDETGILIDVDTPIHLTDALERYARHADLLETHGQAGLARAMSLDASDSEAEVIDRIVELARSAPPKLPNAARIWFDLPRLTQVRGSGDRLFLSFLGARIARAAVRLLRLPRS